jgi:hypothetical protein
VAEALAPFRGTTFRPGYLRRSGHPLALVTVDIADSLAVRIVDCTVPEVLARYNVRPDDLAHHDRTVTQAIARRLHDAGLRTGNPAGLRWWSALTGAWHTIVVFTDRENAGEVVFGGPQIVDGSHPALLRAAAVLGIRMPHGVR